MISLLTFTPVKKVVRVIIRCRGALGEDDIKYTINMPQALFRGICFLKKTLL